MSVSTKRAQPRKATTESATARKAAAGHSRRDVLKFAVGLGAGLVLAGSSGTALAGNTPEDIMKGMLIISDEKFPTSWKSPGEYAGRLKKMHKTALPYDKKTKKLQVYYAAFFAKPVDDVQVNFVIYDITDKTIPKVKKGAWEAFLGRKGERALFNSIELDQEDIEANKKYLFTVERHNVILARGEITLTAEKPKFSGKVEFSEDEARGKKPVTEPAKKD
jgi:hypothetical protein